MPILLGVDTGGTYTDAVLIRDEKEVIATAKSLTTRHDLAEGIGAAVRAVLRDGAVAPADVSMASLSTTLATNALVEGQGGRIALILIGFQERDLDTHGLRDALKGDPVLICSGGHDHAGAEVAALDLEQVRQFLRGQAKDVSAFAVAAQFATRNPAHELEVAALIGEVTGRPVSASHALSAKLNGPKRAMTALLNARLVGMIDRLIGRAEDMLRALGITAPMMVVRGDGALISALQARHHPIETILSGPAASLVGARWLTGAQDALVSDIGGTTTDIALLRNGRPAIDPAGARVGPYRTMVEAVAMRTTGLGGDSAVEMVSGGLARAITLGPRRVIPVSLMAHHAPEVVHAALDAALRAAAPGEHDARFVQAVRGQSTEGLGARETTLLDRIGTGIHPLGAVLRARLEHSALNRLVERGLVQLGGVTPSDASHVLGTLADWDAEAARKALVLLARRRSGAGEMLARTAQDMAQMIVDQLTQQTVTALLEAAFAEENADFGGAAGDLARHGLMQAGLRAHRGLLRFDAALDVPIVGLGASAQTYYPAVGRAVRSEMVLPAHAGVANAIGAVVGRVTMRRAGSVTAPSDGMFRVHFDSGPQDFTDCDAALVALEAWLTERARADAAQAGAADIQISVTRDIKTAGVEAREVFVEAMITVEAAGRPRVAV
ncbi:hydantoinase/oxoprolinase family protein [Roseobacter denitrificans]|uniref:Hydantoinase/oxoprolinase, putative n=1 Tax=Roseobacter denitrificans (strain ATCC 33942 / OCh 114) TaxID=375451 RepID=Q16E00_ROSDO|nr:hydantoinase/oxoprolinase family protein [Roseobacter denitrificans]ABG29793.1 hydantoinase/oxoprolinase, putative [Roseobacter denitrificans OCh 114]AVL53021.1 hydantoinase/oxoprolinase family protein [Roseobacter denitrificans]SFG26979.1 N-methylhydantoinase A/oxoprolinase/acetone carboxylase, beta subunit [Roseobacter denitrificans OCh 114]